MTEGIVVCDVDPKVSVVRGAAGVECRVSSCDEPYAGGSEDAIYWFSVCVLVASGRWAVERVYVKDNFFDTDVTESCGCVSFSNVFIGVDADDDVIS